MHSCLPRRTGLVSFTGSQDSHNLFAMRTTQVSELNTCNTKLGGLSASVKRLNGGTKSLP